jgi:hypothetical protein
MKRMKCSAIRLSAWPLIANVRTESDSQQKTNVGLSMSVNRQPTTSSQTIPG